MTEMTGMTEMTEMTGMTEMNRIDIEAFAVDSGATSCGGHEPCFWAFHSQRLQYR